jgi:hypothetical protein
MSKRTQTSNQTQEYKNSYGWEQSPITPQMQAVLDMSNQATKVDPSIQHRYAAAEEDLNRSYMDPYGAYTTPDVREKALRSQKAKLFTERDKSMREGYADADNQTYARRVGAAAMTAPQMVSTGGSSSGNSTTKQEGGFWMAVLPSMMQGAGTAAA